MKPVLIALLLGFVITPYSLMAADAKPASAMAAVDETAGKLFDGSGIGILVWVIAGFAGGFFVAQRYQDKLPRLFKPAPDVESITKTVTANILDELRKLNVTK